MGYYENDPNRDENGEPLMDFDDMLFDEEVSLEDEDTSKDRQREGSITPVHESNLEFKAMPTKKLSAKESTPPCLDSGNDFSTTLKRKGFKGGESGKKEKKRKSDERLGKGSKNGRNSGRSKDHGDDPEIKELWDTIAGADSEVDKEGIRTVDDVNFIDDSGVDPAHLYGSDNEVGSPSNAPQAEEGEKDDEFDQLFKGGKKKRKHERTAEEIALIVEEHMAELEVQAEEDVILNQQSKPAINKLKKLPLLTEVLSKKPLQREFLDHGVLNLLKNWLEPLPDGSLPSINIRSGILNILTEFPLDLEQFDRREQLKRSGLGKVIMFLSKSDEETMANKRLAKDLVDKWSRPIFNKSIRFEDRRNSDDERIPYRSPSVKKPVKRATDLGSTEDDLDIAVSRVSKSIPLSSKQHASRPEALALDFMVRPQSKIDPDEIRARAKRLIQDQHRMKMSKKMQQMKSSKKKQLQAAKLSAEGRGLFKYF